MYAPRVFSNQFTCTKHELVLSSFVSSYVVILTVRLTVDACDTWLLGKMYWKLFARTFDMMAAYGRFDCKVTLTSKYDSNTGNSWLCAPDEQNKLS